MVLFEVFDHTCENNNEVDVEVINGYLCVRNDPSGELLFGDRILKINGEQGTRDKIFLEFLTPFLGGSGI